MDLEKALELLVHDFIIPIPEKYDLGKNFIL